MLSEPELRQLLRTGESQFLERKASLPKTGELRATLCAFANSTVPDRHSALVIGVSDKGVRQGIDPAMLDSYQKTLGTVCRNDCYPPIDNIVTPHIVEEDAKTFLIVTVGFSNNRPHFSGPAYVRSGSESRKANETQFAELIAARTDKVRKILSAKDGLVSVYWKNRPAVVGAIGSSSKWKNLNEREYSIVSCDNFTLELLQHPGLNKMAMPISEVEISRDVERSRMQLIIDFRHLYKG